MPDKYIVNMTEKTTPEDTNLLVIEDSQDTKRMTWSNLVKPIKDMIGNLASLNTTHKATVVGAINEIQASLSEPTNLGNGVSYRTIGKVCMVSINSFSGGSVTGLPEPAGYVLIRLWEGSTSPSYIQYSAGSWKATGTGGYGTAVYLMR